MTVSELIEELKKHKQDATVQVEDADFDILDEVVTVHDFPVKNGEMVILGI